MFLSFIGLGTGWLKEFHRFLSLLAKAPLLKHPTFLWCVIPLEFLSNSRLPWQNRYLKWKSFYSKYSLLTRCFSPAVTVAPVPKSGPEEFLHSFALPQELLDNLSMHWSCLIKDHENSHKIAGFCPAVMCLSRSILPGGLGVICTACDARQSPTMPHNPVFSLHCAIK